MIISDSEADEERLYNQTLQKISFIVFGTFDFVATLLCLYNNDHKSNSWKKEFRLQYIATFFWK